MFQKYENFISFHCLPGLQFGKRKGFFKEKKNKEVAIYYVPTQPLIYRFRAEIYKSIAKYVAACL